MSVDIPERDWKKRFVLSDASFRDFSEEIQKRVQSLFNVRKQPGIKF